MLFENNPYVDAVCTINDKVSEVAEHLGSEHYDYVIDLHANLRSAQVKRLVKALAFAVDKRNFAKWLYVNTKKEWLSIGHFSDRCLEAVSALGIMNDGKGLDFFIPDHARISTAVLPETHRQGFVLYVIGGKMKGKILPTEKAIDLCKSLGRPVVLIGGPEDKERGDEIAGTNSLVWNACGQFNIMQSASLIELSDVVLTHDTGLMHMAAALKKRVISMWFATTPLLGFAPYHPGEGSQTIEADCSKRPTSKLGNRGFQDGCVFNIDIERVVKAVNG